MSVSCECHALSEVTASGRSLVRRSPTECFVFDCDLEISGNVFSETVRRIFAGVLCETEIKRVQHILVSLDSKIR
jgi:hypothetical protein